MDVETGRKTSHWFPGKRRVAANPKLEYNLDSRQFKDCLVVPRAGAPCVSLWRLSGFRGTVYAYTPAVRSTWSTSAVL